MIVAEVDDRRCLALCSDEEGRRHTVEIALVEPVTRGDRILVHAGTAIAALAAVEQEAAVKQQAAV